MQSTVKGACLIALALTLVLMPAAHRQQVPAKQAQAVSSAVFVADDGAKPNAGGG
ncbi:hypothetical protein [Deinococcus sp.]|uniref:hypothetical protein n=1 Tax=Deinococcus sp. TaxID=47478 RepID=UPI003CC560C7